MNLPVASCMICGVEKELAVWVDPALTISYKGVCFECRENALKAKSEGAGLSPLARKQVEEIIREVVTQWLSLTQKKLEDNSRK